jgi:phenylalanyl-tRNA synthetase beta chain
MRIDGLDNIEIPATISIAPSADNDNGKAAMQEKIANNLTGSGFAEIFTNSITDSKYYDEAVLSTTVKMINNLSANLDVMRPSLLQTGLEVVAYNHNRKNANLKMYEFGKTYHTSGVGKYSEKMELALFTTGTAIEGSWKQKDVKADFYFLKGVCEKILASLGIKNIQTSITENTDYEYAVAISIKDNVLAQVGAVSKKIAKQFGIKEDVLCAIIAWDEVVKIATEKNISYKEVSKFPVVQRDLAIILDKSIAYAEVENAIKENKIVALKSTKLFDIFESDKLGKDKRSMAINFSFSDDTKTLEDADTEMMMQKIITNLEKKLQAEIRK